MFQEKMGEAQLRKDDNSVYWKVITQTTMITCDKIEIQKWELNPGTNSTCLTWHTRKVKQTIANFQKLNVCSEMFSTTMVTKQFVIILINIFFIFYLNKSLFEGLVCYQCVLGENVNFQFLFVMFYVQSFSTFVMINFK